MATLRTLGDRGGSASIQKPSDHVARQLGLPDEILDIPHKDGPQSEIDNRAVWARTHLKHVEAVDNTSKGVWAIAEVGRIIQKETASRDLVRQDRKRRNQQRIRSVESQDGNEHAPEILRWQDNLLDIVRGIPPDAFESLCQRILRELGFTKVKVTGRSGNGGIDGARVLRVNPRSFRARFHQCKRYSGSVGARDIRDLLKPWWDMRIRGYSQLRAASRGKQSGKE